MKPARTTHDRKTLAARLLPFAGLLTVLALISPDVQADTQTRASAFDYDAVSGLLTKEIIEPDDPALCLVTSYTYDGYGNQTGSTTRNCNGSTGSVPGTNSEAAAPTGDAVIETRTAATTYDAQGRFPVSATNALAQTETRTWNGDYGTLASLTGPNKLTTTWTYDSFGRQTGELRPDGTSTGTGYAFCGTDTSCPTAANGVVPQYAVITIQPGAPTGRSYHDQLGRAIQTETQGMDGTLIYAQTQYDHLGRPWKTSRPYRTGATPAWTTVAYDILGRATATTALDSNGVAATSTVGYNGFTVVATNALGQTRTEVRNSQGQLKSVTDTYQQTLTYTYDAYGNLTRTTDPQNNIIAASYDKRGRKTAMNDPDQGNWSYVYDALGQLKRQTDAKGQIVTFTYDKLGRMTSRLEPDLNSTWSYDTCDATLNPAGKCIGKPVRETSDNGYVRTSLYDSYGRPTAELDNIDQGYGVARTFDGYGRVANLVYPSGFQVSNVYSASGHLTQVKDTATQLVYWQATAQDAEGRITSEVYGNNVTTTRTWDANTGRLTQVKATAGAGAVLTGPNVTNQSYVYDPLGNLTQRYDAVTGLNEAYGYDNLNRLTSTSAQAGSGPLTQVSVQYSSLGNITYKSDVGSYTYGKLDANGKLIQPHAVTRIMMTDGITQYAAYTYDANGNQTAGAGRSLAWTSWNMSAGITGTSQGKSTPNGTAGSSYQLVYNAAHERVKETLPDGTVVYNVSPRVDTGIHVEKRIKPDGTVQYVNALYAGSMPFGTHTEVRYAASTTTYNRYYHTDHLGSIVAITDDQGNVTERRSFDAWGKHRNSNGTALANAFVTPEERHGYTGHEELDDVGLIHMNGRLYDPATGRFLSADPGIQYPDDLQNYNRYSYVNNNPCSATDPSGYGFFSSLFKAIRSVVRSVLHAVRAVLRNPVIRMAIAMYVGSQIGIGADGFGLFGGSGTAMAVGSPVFVNTTTDLVLNGAAAGFAGGFIASGGNFKAGISGAISGGVLGGIRAAFDNQWTWGRVTVNSLAGGALSKLHGGNFMNGMINALRVNIIRMGWEYTQIVTDRIKLAACASGVEGEVCRYNSLGHLLSDGTRGINQTSLENYGVALNNLPQPVAWILKNIAGVGMGREGYGPGDLCSDGTACGHFYSPNSFFGIFINMVSKPHDWWNSWTYGTDGLRVMGGPVFEAGFNLYSFIGMPIAGAFTTKAISADWSLK